MSYGRYVAAWIATATIGSLLLLTVSGVMTASAQPFVLGPARIHINGGVVVVGHAVLCFVQEGSAQVDATGTGSFVADLKRFVTKDPCGTIAGNITAAADAHTAGFSGFFSGVITRHSGPQPAGSFVGLGVGGTWQINNVSGGPSPLATGEGNLNIF